MLAGLEGGLSYAGILDGGVAAAEVAPEDPGEQAVLVGALQEGTLHMDEQRLQPGAVLEGGFTLTGGGPLAGCVAILAMPGARDSEHEMDNLCDSGFGLSLVVFNRQTGRLVDNAVFDPATGQRVSDQPSERYAERLADARARAVEEGLA